MSTSNRDIRPPDREHPSDLLPDFLRGTLDPEHRRDVAAHLEGCSMCADELELLTLLAEHPVPSLTEEERSRVYDRLGFGVPASTGVASRSNWRSGLWKAAAVIAFLATGIGVWQIYLAGTSETGWSATAVLEAWERDVREIDPSSEDALALLAFFESGPESGIGERGGDSALDGVVDEVLDGLAPGVLDGMAAPWEEEQ